MLNKNWVASLLSVTTILIVAYICFVSFANLGWNNTKIGTETEAETEAETKATKTHPLVLGKELQSVVENLAGDVLISVRTTAAFHNSRLSVQLLTWMQSVPRSQLLIVTDGFQNDSWVQMLTNEGYQVTVTNCPQTHQRDSLCCKSGREYDLYYKVMEEYRWFCHLDDDMYLNTKALSKLLSKHDWIQPLYLGYFPLAKPWELGSQTLSLIKDVRHMKKAFRFATGGTYCISQPLMRMIEPYFRGDNFNSLCKQFRLPDDVLIGLVVEVLLGYNLTVVSSIKTHLQGLGMLKPEELVNMISISYGGVKNRIKLLHANFSIDEDQSGFLSFHCLLYPEVKWCT